MNNRALVGLLLILLLACHSRDVHADPGTSTADPDLERELLVPYDDLHILLSSPTRRVLLPRDEYEALLEASRKHADAQAPEAVVWVAAEYDAVIEDNRAVIEGRLTLDVLRRGLNAVPIVLGGVGVRSVVIDGEPAPLGMSADGDLNVFVEGIGRHTMRVSLESPVDTEGVHQILNLQLPTAAANRFRITARGDVDVKSGLPVVSRAYDPAIGVTRFELLPDRGPMSLVMSLNSRFDQTDALLVARGLNVSRISDTSEALHATVSMDVLGRPVDRFGFDVPNGFEITDVRTTHLARWTIDDRDGHAVLSVGLTQPVSDTQVVRITARKTAALDPAWSLARIKPLDVISDVSVVGVVLSDRWRISAFVPEGLIPIDVSSIAAAVPPRGHQRDATHERAVVAYYAPNSQPSLSARLERVPEELSVTTTMLLSLTDQRQSVRGGFAITPLGNDLFSFDVLVPGTWHLTKVADSDGAALSFELLAQAISDDAQRPVRIHLPQGIHRERPRTVYFRAQSQPRGWVSDWEATEIEFPVFKVIGATTDKGAIAVETLDDFVVRPGVLNGLTPLDDDERPDHGFEQVSPDLAYRYDQTPYDAVFDIRRIQPRIRARTISSFRLDHDILDAHYELIYEIDRARTRRLSLLLPDSTPRALSINGLGGVEFKDIADEPVDGGMRRWTITLETARKGTVRVAVDLVQQLDDAAPSDLDLPVVHADNVAYQSGLVSVEADSDIEVQVASESRRVDVGELAAAEYLPGPGLLGVFGFVGTPRPVTVRVDRPEQYGLLPAIVERATLISNLSPNGTCQTVAKYTMRTKALFLDIRLPTRSTFWAATLNDHPTKPQRDADRLLLDLPASKKHRAHVLTIVYETAIDPFGASGSVELLGPVLALHATGGSGDTEIPVADLQWDLHPPNGYRIVRSNGTVTAVGQEAPRSAVGRLVRWLSVGRGGRVDQPVVGLENEAAQSARPKTEHALQKISRLSVKHAAKNRPAETPYRRSTDELLGLRSLKIDLARRGHYLRFHSLGGDPRLEFTLIEHQRLVFAGWFVALALVLKGLLLANRTTRVKAWYVIGVCFLATLPAIVVDRNEIIYVCNAAFYAGMTLVPLYLLIGAVIRYRCRRVRPRVLAAPVAAPLVVALMVCLTGASVSASDNRDCCDEGPPVRVPDDAVIVPYDALDLTGAGTGDQVLIPYRRYTELFDRAHGDDAMAQDVPPVPYALAGATYTATLLDEPYLRFDGRLEIEVYSDKTVQIPIALNGGVLSAALLDGQPARLGSRVDRTVRSRTAIHDPAGWTALGVAPWLPDATAPDPSTTTLFVSGPGRHRLEFEVRLPLPRVGGWRVATGRLPSAQATALTLVVPHEKTEIAVTDPAARRVRETTEADERIVMALPVGGSLDIRWRPKVDTPLHTSGMKAHSKVLFDLQEDQLRAEWRFDLRFPRAERETFSVRTPSDYLVESVTGDNIRGWTTAGADGSVLQISLLDTARNQESFVVRMRRRATSEVDSSFTTTVPMLTIEGATVQDGTIVIRRSPRLAVRTIDAPGGVRIDIPDQSVTPVDPNGVRSLLGIRPHEAYRFGSPDAAVRLNVAPLPVSKKVRVQTVLKIGRDVRRLESRLISTVTQGRIYQIRAVIPDDLVLDRVWAPGQFEWSVTARDADRVLTIVLGTGQAEDVPVVIAGHLADSVGLTRVTLPCVAALDVAEQEGEMVVQVDPGMDLSATDLRNCRSVLMSRVHRWLDPSNRRLARLAIHHEGPHYGGTLMLAQKEPDVSCDTVTSIRITDHAIMETLMLDFDIREAGLRQVVFLIPERLAQADIAVPLLRQKTVVSADDVPGWVRVTLAFQDAMMGRLRVLIEDDRLLGYESETAPIPVVETGRTGQRFVAFESIGRDEANVESHQGLEPVGKQQAQQHALSRLLANGTARSYVANDPKTDPRFEYRVRSRKAVRTAGARIGLAQTVLVLDASGAYRASVVYSMDNTTEQFLEIELPPGARLWTARVDGQPVKPARSADPGSERRVRVPLIRTAAGDLDYKISLQYAGTMVGMDRWGTRRFPMVQAVNINVELSQARLYLPESHRWINFGGSMRMVTAAGDLEAGYLSYRTKVVQQLTQTLREDNVYAQVRASRHLEDLKAEIGAYQDQVDMFADNDELRRQQASHRKVLKAAEQAAQTIDAAPEDRANADSRRALSDYWAVQHNTRSGKALAELKGNFESVERHPQSASLGNATNADDPYQRWLTASGLGGDDPERSNLRDGERDRIERRFNSLGMGSTTRPAPASPPPAIDNGLIAKDQGRPAVDEEGVSEILGDDLSEHQKALLYNQRLDESQRLSGDKRRRMLQSTEAFEESALPKKELETDQPGRLTVTGGSAPLASGLASLEVLLPTRGVEYLFTTPRGQVEITANAIPSSTLRKAWQLAAYAIVAAGVVVWRRRMSNTASTGLSS